VLHIEENKREHPPGPPSRGEFEHFRLKGQIEFVRLKGQIEFVQLKGQIEFVRLKGEIEFIRLKGEIEFIRLKRGELNSFRQREERSVHSSHG
jgi:uncharacterized pyridoxamine 5'-phosphate oxidase family protein